MHRFRVEIKNGSDHDVLYSPYYDDRQIYDDELSLELGVTPTFNFSVPAKNPAAELIEPLAAKIFVYDGDSVIYAGRVSNDGADILSTGSVETVGAMSYLADSQQEPFSFSGTISEYISKLLTAHNAQSEAKFQAGQHISGNIEVTSNEYKDTLSLFQESIQGGYLRARYLADNSYALDYLASYGDNSQVVRLGENIADLNSQRSPEDIATRLIPLGAELEANDTSTLPQYVKINNGGVAYIENAELKARYGTIVKVKQWEDITDPSVLLSTAQAYLNNMVLPESFVIDAVDLSYVDDGVAAFEVGCNTHIISAPHGVDTWYMLAKKTVHLTDPARDSITLGEVEATLSKQVVSNEAQASTANANTKTELSNTIVKTGMTITGAKGGYVVLDTYDDQGNAVAPWQILIMDTADKQTAKNVIRMNQNGIGFSTDGYDGPYDNAWTIDGNLNATFIRSGNLIIGGSVWNTDGAIVIADSNDKEIGRWDKTGLMVKKGSIEGTTIEVGPFSVNDDIVQLGDFEVSADGSNTFKSNNGEITIELAMGGPTGSYNRIVLVSTETDRQTIISDHHVESPLGEFYDANLQSLEDEYGSSWRSVSKNIIELWNHIDQLENNSGGGP